MQLYYVQIHVEIERTYASYEHYVYFNSKEAMDDWIEAFNTDPEKSTLEHIVDKGKAYFNTRGILNP